MQVRCFSTTSTLLKSITPHKATGVFYTDLERLTLTLPADLYQVLFGCLLGESLPGPVTDGCNVT